MEVLWVNSSDKEEFEKKALAECQSEIDDLKEFDGDIFGYIQEALGFDFVEAGTFPDIGEPFYRLQISYGGPSSELRFFSDRTEYVFMDWFQGAGIETNEFDVVRQEFEDLEMIDYSKLTGA